jgi:carbon storage regulator
MLILTRRVGQCITVGENIVVKILEIDGTQVRVGVDAPRSVPVHRQEIYLALAEANRAAAENEAPSTLAPASLAAQRAKR